MTVTNGHNPSSVRASNRRLVLDILRNSGEMTVSQIAEQIRLSKTTIWKIIGHFLSSNVLVSAGKDDASEELGKKPELYQFNASYGYVISISVNGSSILLALTDARAAIYYKEKIGIGEDEPIERVVGMIASFIRKWQEPSTPNFKKGSRLLGIVLASPGVVDSQRGLCYTASRFGSWPPEAPIKNMIMEQVELKAPFFIDNYNRFYAFAEKALGCARDKKNIVDVVAGYDGLGAGVIAENRIERGPRYLTGEIGHMCLSPDDQEICHCGGRGCFEQLVSCERLIRKARAGKNDHAESLIYDTASDSISIQRVFNASNEGDSWACELIDEITDWFAIALHNVIVVFNPELIVISGDYRNAGRYFLKELIRKIERVGLVRMNKHVDIRYATFDEEGPLIGGAAYVLEDYFNRQRSY